MFDPNGKSKCVSLSFKVAGIILSVFILISNPSRQLSAETTAEQTLKKEKQAIFEYLTYTRELIGEINYLIYMMELRDKAKSKKDDSTSSIYQTFLTLLPKEERKLVETGSLDTIKKRKNLFAKVYLDVVENFSRSDAVLVNAEGNSVFEFSLRIGVIEATRRIIDKFEDINKVDIKGDPILFTALKKNKPDILAYLVDKGADLTRINKDQLTPLMYAIKNTRKKAVDVLIKRPESINYRNEKGESALLIAAEKAGLELNKRLVDKGADIFVTNKNSDSPLTLSANRSDQLYDFYSNLYRKAATKGNPVAQYSIGLLTEFGKKFDQNYSKAADWYSKAAEQGFHHAQSNLATLFFNGSGVEQSYPAALKWNRLAADQGNATAQSNLGLMYYYGLGLERDFQQAIKWYHKAAEQGSAWSQNKLGDIYLYGNGAPQDLKKANYWSSLSYNNNFEGALGSMAITQVGIGEKEKYKSSCKKLTAKTDEPFNQKKEPTETMPYLTGTWNHLLCGNFSKVIEYGEKGLKTKANSPIHHGMLIMNSGWASLCLNKKEDAIKKLKKAKTYGIDNQGFQNDMKIIEIICSDRKADLPTIKNQLF